MPQIEEMTVISAFPDTSAERGHSDTPEAVLSINSAVTTNGLLGIVNHTILYGLTPAPGRSKHPLACQDASLGEGPASSPMRDAHRGPVSAAKPIPPAAASLGTGGV